MAQPHQPGRLPLPTEEPQAAAGGPDVLVRGDQDPHGRAVHELDPAQVDRDIRQCGARDAAQPTAQCRGRGEVELAAEGDQGQPPDVAPGDRPVRHGGLLTAPRWGPPLLEGLPACPCPVPKSILNSGGRPGSGWAVAAAPQDRPGPRIPVPGMRALAPETRRPRRAADGYHRAVRAPRNRGVPRSEVELPCPTSW